MARIAQKTPMLLVDGVDIGERVHSLDLTIRSGDDDNLDVVIWDHDAVPITYDKTMAVRVSWDEGRNWWECRSVKLTDHSVDKYMQCFRLAGQHFLRQR